jgi:hypothetical protein
MDLHETWHVDLLRLGRDYAKVRTSKNYVKMLGLGIVMMMMIIFSFDIQ